MNNNALFAADLVHQAGLAAFDVSDSDGERAIDLAIRNQRQNIINFLAELANNIETSVTLTGNSSRPKR